MDASDEARLLRFLNPLMNVDGDIEIVGHCWDPDCSKWEESRVFLKDICSSDSYPDQYSAQKHHVDSLINGLAKDVAIHNFVATSGNLHKPLVYSI